MLLALYVLLLQVVIASVEVYRRYSSCHLSYGDDHLYQLCNSTLYRDDVIICDTVINPIVLHYNAFTDKIYIGAEKLLEYSPDCELLETRDYGWINWVTSNQSATLVGGYVADDDIQVGDINAFVCSVDEGECEYWETIGVDSVYRMELDGSNIYSMGVYNNEYAVFDKSTYLTIRFIPWHIVVTDKVYVVGFGTNSFIIATIDKGLTTRDPHTITGTLMNCEKLYCGYHTRSTLYLIRIDTREIFYERRFGNDLIYGIAESVAIDEERRKVAFGLNVYGEINLDGVLIQPGYFVIEVNVTFPISQNIQIPPTSTASTRANLRRPSVNATSNSSIIPLIVALAFGSAVALAVVIFFIYRCTSTQQKVVQYQAPTLGLPLEQSFISEPTFTAQDTVQSNSSQRSFDLSSQDYEVLQVFRDGADSKTELVRVLRDELKQRAAVAVLRTYKQQPFNIANEINILSHFKENRHFVRLVAFSRNMICMRYYQDGDVSTKELSIENIVSVARDIAFALVKLHDCGYVHFELCSSRVLLEIDAKTGLYRAVLSGFGNVVPFPGGIANVEPYVFQRLRADSYAYLAPEIVSRLVTPQNTTTAIPVDMILSFDSFSWAMVVYEMINFEKPWRRIESKSAMFQKVLRDERPEFNDRGMELKLDERIARLTDIVFQAWDPRSQLRPNSKKILQMLE